MRFHSDLSRSTGDPDLADGQPSAVETFMFEVSAGKKGSPTIPHPVDRTKATLRVTPSPVRVARSTKLRAKPATATAVVVDMKRWRMPSWMASLALHVVGIASLSFITIPGLRQSFDFSLDWAENPGIVEEIVFDEIAVEPLADFKAAENQLTEAFEAADLTNEITLTEFSSESLASVSISDAVGLFSAEGQGLSELVPSGEKLTASFFGTKVDGKRILYILDNSGGMQDGGLEMLIVELMRSVESLSEKQQFYVIFYSDMLYPLFYPRTTDRFVPANDRFKKRLEVWLEKVEFCVGNTVDEAIQAAASIRPDAVYLLTDGDVNTTRDGRKLAALTDVRGRDFPVHTFGIGMSEWSKAADNLRLIAEANRGTFRAVEISDEAKVLAKQKKRPYHNKEAGKVWGLNVRGAWGRN